MQQPEKKGEGEERPPRTLTSSTPRRNTSIGMGAGTGREEDLEKQDLHPKHPIPTSTCKWEPGASHARTPLCYSPGSRARGGDRPSQRHGSSARSPLSPMPPPCCSPGSPCPPTRGTPRPTHGDPSGWRRHSSPWRGRSSATKGPHWAGGLGSCGARRTSQAWAQGAGGKAGPHPLKADGTLGLPEPRAAEQAGPARAAGDGGHLPAPPPPPLAPGGRPPATWTRP